MSTAESEKMVRLNEDAAPYSGAKNGAEMKVAAAASESSLLPSGSSGQLSPLVCGEYKPLMEKIRRLVEAKEPFFSLEFFPPKTALGVANFLQRLDRLREGGPLFCDVTWHMGSDPGSDKETSSSSVAGASLNYCGLETMLHVTAAQYSKEQTLEHLERAKRLGIRNILALRGDLDYSKGYTLSNIKYKAVDLVRWIRERYGDYFGIAVAGYPTGHPDAESYAHDLDNLKAKIDAGADMIITQLFFEAEEFEKFVRDCREAGINVPIVPGIMPIQSYKNIQRIAELSKLIIPQHILDAMEPFKNDDDRVRNYGIQMASDMCRQLLANGTAPSLHMYTLNLENATRQILQNVGLWQSAPTRALPWKQATANFKRATEDVRPIFWSSRPKSYVCRTRDWDDFPNGRWGALSSPAFGDLHDYYLFYLKDQKPPEKLLPMWGTELKSEKDVWSVFEAFVSGKDNAQGVKVTRLPWSETDQLAVETSLIAEKLAYFNSQGVLSINSQPAVNGAPSSDPLVGWGSPGGYCYQKAYVEFFVRKELALKLPQLLADHPRINYHIINADGSIDLNNAVGNNPMAVTWGVFPGAEVAQPTVVDPESFRVWKDEAFDTWLSHWAKLYPDGSPSRQVLQDIHDGYCLVTLVDNDYVAPVLIWDVLDQMLAA